MYTVVLTLTTPVTSVLSYIIRISLSSQSLSIVPRKSSQTISENVELEISQAKILEICIFTFSFKVLFFVSVIFIYGLELDVHFQMILE
jgi:hypothetical protein